MTSRVQTLRSSTPGNIPAAGTQAPGTVWTNFSDLQLGVIDATKTAQPLIAVRFFSTTANYATGAVVVQAGAIYIAKGAVTAGAFNSAQWTKIAALTDIPALYVLPTASTSVLGGVKIDGTTITINSGVISSAGLVAVATTPPSSPQNGSLWYDLVGGQLYTYVNDGSSNQWVIAVNSTSFLPVASTTVLGGVKVDGTTIQAAADGTISTIIVPMGDNRIINGDMRIDQRNAGAVFAFVPGSYTVDRWQYNGTQTNQISGGQNVNSVVGPVGFPYYLGSVSQSAHAVLAADFFQIYQSIEADMISDFAWGTASAQPVTLSFWARSSLTGTFSGVLGNYAGTRSYAFSYSLPTANTWTKIVLNIPGDTAGAWVMSGNGGSLSVHFDLGSGATFRIAAGAWTAGNYVGANGAVSLVATNNATFYLTGVKLEIGSVATPFNRQSLAKSMADCQRYYQVFLPYLTVYGNAGATIGYAVPLPVLMRASPTVVIVSPGYANASAATILSPNSAGLALGATVTATGMATVGATLTASAEL